jgi:hypothetical protein
MRLLNVWTGRLEQHLGEIPPYAILSHVWGDEEITFPDLTAAYTPIDETKPAALHDKAATITRWEAKQGSLPFHDASVTKRKGYKKLRYTCIEALRSFQKLDYVWIDTICIDKSSSAELSEAINSQFL